MLCFHTLLLLLESAGSQIDDAYKYCSLKISQYTGRLVQPMELQDCHVTLVRNGRLHLLHQGAVQAVDTGGGEDCPKTSLKSVIYGSWRRNHSSTTAETGGRGMSQHSTMHQTKSNCGRKVDAGG